MEYNYKEIMTIGTIEDKPPREYSGVFDEEIERYFTNFGFYPYTMNPRFMNAWDYDNITKDAPCIRIDFGNDYTFRVFMNRVEMYLEVQNPWRGFEVCNYYKFEKNPDLEAIETQLNLILECLDTSHWEDLVKPW
jgi:hypothetical protein